MSGAGWLGESLEGLADYPIICLPAYLSICLSIWLIIGVFALDPVCNIFFCALVVKFCLFGCFPSIRSNLWLIIYSPIHSTHTSSQQSSLKHDTTFSNTKASLPGRALRSLSPFLEVLDVTTFSRNSQRLTTRSTHPGVWKNCLQAWWNWKSADFL